MGVSQVLSLFRNRLYPLFAKPAVFPVLAFLVPFVVRAVPEVLSGPYPVGFDVFAYYVPNTLSWLRDGVPFWNFLSTAPFLYILLMGITAVGVPIFWTLKVLSPALLGLLGVVVYFYASKTLGWSMKKSLLAVFFATLYFIALRISFDMLRSELALIFLFAALVMVGKEGKVHSWKNGVLLSLSLVLVVFSHQLVAVIALFVVLATVVRFSVDKRIVDVRNLLVGVVPALFLFSLIVYASYAASPAFSVLTGFPAQGSSGFNALFGFSSYSDMVIDTLGFLVFCYLPLLPLLVFGVKRFRWNLQLGAWVAWICIALLFVFVSPNAFFVGYPYRWVLLLTFPLAFVAVDAFARVRSGAKKIGVVLILATLSVSYFALPTNLAFPYLTLYPYYVPTSMAATTIPIADSQDTVNALEWTKNNMSDNSRLLVHEAFFSWASLYLDEGRIIRYGHDEPEVWASGLVRNGSTCHLYLIWWVNGSGWYGQPSVASVFQRVFESGDIAVFIYNPSNNSKTSGTDYQTCIASLEAPKG